MPSQFNSLFETLEGRRFLSAAAMIGLTGDSGPISFVVSDDHGGGNGADDPPGDDHGTGRNGADDPAGDDRGGDNRGDAHDFGTIKRDKKFEDSIGGDDRNDYFKVTLAKTTTFSAKLFDLDANADLALLNNSGRTIKLSHHSGSHDESISRSLTKGTYYVRVTSVSGSTSYHLRLSPT